MSQFLIHEFTPLHLAIDRIGPFQTRLEEIDFTDANNESCNLYLFLSVNGRGKTTALELMAKLMQMLGHASAPEMGRALLLDTTRPFDFEGLDLGLGRAQLDLRMRYTEDGVERTVVLSLIAGQLGPEVSLKFWETEALAKVGARGWHRFGFCRNEAGNWGVVGKTDAWVMDVNAQLGNARGEGLGGFEASSLTWPTILYFSAHRNVTPLANGQERNISEPKNWNYQPSHFFQAEGSDWRVYLDNTLVWLKWLDDGRFERALELVNQRVFDQSSTFIKGVNKQKLEAVVVRDGNNTHRLDALSSGEKSLVQLFLRLGAHMTRNTILLIDEPEAHLHEKWKFRLFHQLKALIQECYPGMTVILATHSQEMMTALALELEEENLRKGGYFFETAEEENRAKEIQEKAIRDYGDIQE